jgi:hypothetical protein
MEEIKMKYYAFISYKREDEKWARWLQRKLESYKLPASIRAQDVTIPKYIRPIFRDNTDLSGTVLQESLDDGLMHSKYLIVICSPHVIESEWVSKEIQQFIDSGREKQILPFVVAGTPMSSDPRKECFPDVLRRLPKERELLGINVQELGKEKAIVRTVSTLMGLQFDTIWNRHRRLLMRQRILKAVALFILLLGALFAWDYTRPTYRYFADWTDRYGVPEGILPLSAEEASHRNRTYRFEYRRIPFGQPGAYHWRVSRVDFVNYLNRPQPYEDPEIILRSPSVRIDYYEDGDVARLTCIDEKGRILFRQRLSEHHGVTAAIADFLSSREQQSLGFNVQHVTGETPDNGALDIMEYLNQSNSNIVRFAYERDSLGLIRVVTFHSSNDYDLSRSLMGNANGIFGLRYERDSLGRPVSMTFLGKDLQPTCDRNGISSKRYSYDAYGNLSELSNFDLEGHPAINSALWARRTFQSDACGNLHMVSYFGLNGQPCICNAQFASVESEYDEHGNLILDRFLGTDGRPCTYFDGFSACRYVYNRRGQLIRETYYDTEDQPCACSKGYVRRDIKNDVRGNILEETYFDADGLRVTTSEGLWRWTMEYDSHNNLTAEAYFDADNWPCNWTDGYARCTTVFNQMDLPIEERYYDVEGHPCPNTKGYTRVVAEYDERGNLVRHTFYDADDHPVVTAKGYAIWVGQYDDRGKRIFVEYRDGTDQPIESQKGYAAVRIAYNEQGKATEHRYYNNVGEPTMIKSGFYRTTTEYDSRGNTIGENYFDTAGQPCAGYDGATGWTATYNISGRVTSVTFHDAQNRPFRLLTEGYAKYENIYDDYFNLAEVRYYDASDVLCNCSEGYAIWRATYDAHGELASEKYFDRAGKEVTIEEDKE